MADRSPHHLNEQSVSSMINLVLDGKIIDLVIMITLD
jgi:hypothetical protein